MNILKNENASQFYRVGNIDSNQLSDFDISELQPIVPILSKDSIYSDVLSRNSIIDENTFDGFEIDIYKLNTEYWDNSVIDNDFNIYYKNEIEFIKDYVLDKFECDRSGYLWEKVSYQISNYDHNICLESFYDIYRLLDQNEEEIWAFGVKRGMHVIDDKESFRRKEAFDYNQDIELELYNGKSISDYLEQPKYNPRNRSFKMKSLKR